MAQYPKPIAELVQPVSDAHLGSLQHLPLVENLHGEYLVSVSHFYDCNLQEGQKSRRVTKQF